MKFSTATALIVSLSGSVLAAPAMDAVDSALLKAGDFAPSKQYKRHHFRFDENEQGNSRSGSHAQGINSGDQYLVARCEGNAQGNSRSGRSHGHSINTGEYLASHCGENAQGNSRAGRSSNQEINTGEYLVARGEAVDASVEGSQRVSDEASKNMAGGSMAPGTPHSPMQARSNMASSNSDASLAKLSQDARAANTVKPQQSE
ncbi:hypothetical protein G6O67_005126 [Ophiocordyceps sinensis]|uniref:Uncharacterized protein n=2 Tax=Ophiocordyceps sinensis TaxID=72228 RepID=A0A8H4V5L5_9HYPO|nr:hypothetical protein OCS_01462 [Ophiocordyceps sinensis CO18]KAF4508789.1 hypothetical protein G6O67_005126 [Ophiocordyceps sinensis]